MNSVEIIVASVTATMHSYTVQPIFSAGGTLSPPSFLVLKETNLVQAIALNCFPPA